MKKYLYGASVQGIQGFIFETNKLKEIGGASELVEQICTQEFKEHLKEKKQTFKINNSLIMAAGNIKYQFDSYDDCQSVVDDFAKRVMEKAPGVSISQAIVSFDSEEPSSDDINLLEEKLKIQRNRTFRQHGLGWMISERSRNTGSPGIDWDSSKYSSDKVVIDEAQQLKRKANNPATSNLMDKILYGYHPNNRIAKFEKALYPYDIDDIVNKQQNQWIAVVHADGNSLGMLIQQMAKSLKDSGESVKEGFSKFSKQLDAATTQAANDAFNKIVKKQYEKEVLESKNNKLRLPIRPVVIGGDDLTIIIRGDLAIDFTNEFLNQFIARTAEYLNSLVSDYNLNEFKNGLSACAGIAYVKPSYPLHYAIELAEELCSYSKTKAKLIDDKNVPSCLTFHKVQSSFVNNYENSIVERELKAGDIYMNFGPYATDKNYEKLPTVYKLKEQVKEVKRTDSPKSNLRNWLSELSVSTERAEQLLNRIKTITRMHFLKVLKLENAIVERDNKKYTHIHDILSLASIEKN